MKAKDDDVLGVSVSALILAVEEGDAAGATYTLVLDAQPSVAIPVTVSPAAGSSVSVDPEIVTFTTLDWDTPKTVRVSAPEDAKQYERNAWRFRTASRTPFADVDHRAGHRPCTGQRCFGDGKSPRRCP